MIFLLYLFLINPVKILLFKFYKVLRIWESTNIYNILFHRMFGLILSILIFTNIINFLQGYINILVLIYLYLLIISVLTEIFKIRDKHYLILAVHTPCILSNRDNINILSIIMKFNQIKSLDLYISKSKENKIKFFEVGYTWELLNLINKLKNKPNFDLYDKLWWWFYKTSDRINEYIFFNYYKWEVPIDNWERLIETKDKNDFYNLRVLYEYDAEMFKVILFIMWDLMKYLDLNVKEMMLIDDGDATFKSIELHKSTNLEQMQYLEKIQDKLENLYLSKIDLVLFNKYDLYFKSVKDTVNKYRLSSKEYQDKYEKYSETFKNYLLINNKVIDSDISGLIELSCIRKQPLDIKVYAEFINEWYKEWEEKKNLNNKEKELEYEKTLKELEIRYKKLEEFLLKEVNKIKNNEYKSKTGN